MLEKGEVFVPSAGIENLEYSHDPEINAQEPGWTLACFIAGNAALEEKKAGR